MSDKIIRINSVQGFAATWQATRPTTLDLLDFTIPRGMTVDLSKSYIAVNCEIIHNQGDNVMNQRFYVDVEDNFQFNVPSSTLIRNASITCDRGQIENIRRNDSLACALWAMSNDAETCKGDLNMLGTFEDERGINNHTSYLLDCVVNNTNPDGTSDGRRSRQIARDIKIPIKDIFGIGQAEDWSTDIFGETRIHLETNIGKKLSPAKVGGDEDTSLSFDGSTFWGACNAISAAPAGTAVSELTLTVNYIDLDENLTCPFYVGEPVVLGGGHAPDGGGAGSEIGAGNIKTSTILAGGTGNTVGDTGALTGGTGTGATYTVTTVTTGAVTAYTVDVQGLGYVIGDVLTMSQGGADATITVNTVSTESFGVITQIEKVIGTEKNLKLTFAAPIYTVGAGAAEDLSSLTIKAQNSQVQTVVVNRAELVLYTVDEPNPSESFRYMTYLTEQDNGNARPELHRQYIVEPECQNLLVASIENNVILPSHPYTSYRMSIDNEDITGNRSVAVDTPLQYDRLNRCLNENSNIDWKNAQMKYYNSDGTQTAAMNSPITMICETMPLTNENKKVGIEIDATGATVEQLILYKQIQKTI